MGNEELKDTLIVRELRAEKFGLAAAPSAVGASFTITNWTSDVAMDCNAAADAEIADVLGTLIKELQTKGIIGGTTSA